MSSATPIRLTDISKCFRIYQNPRDRFKQAFIDRWHLIAGSQPDIISPRYREHWALRNISFEVNAGETVGILGRNGAGKSTLLQIIAGTLAPTTGSVEVSGRINALLELGSGFNPEFTGRENVYLNAQILGLSRQEAENRFDDIASFADIGEYLDQPVKTYSSGMLMRLAFAVQTAMDPALLIVDEALSVGDMFFQAKCMTRINRLVNDGVALLFVSHDVSAVRQLCRRAVLLEDGQVSVTGRARDVADQYVRRHIEERNRATDSFIENVAHSSYDESIVCDPNMGLGRELFARNALFNRVGNKHAEFVNVQVLRGGIYTKEFDYDDAIEIRLYALFHRDMENVNISLKVRSPHGLDIIYLDTRLLGKVHERYTAGTVYRFSWNVDLPLQHGTYVLGCGMSHPPGPENPDWAFIDIVPIAYEFQVAPRQSGMIDGFVSLPASLEITALSQT